jgi:hypothetical protein
VQPILGPVVQQPLHELSRRRSDAGCLPGARLTAGHQARYFVRREVRQDGLALARLAGTIVRGHRLVVGGEQLDRARAAAGLQRLTDEAVGRRVVAALEHDVAVPVKDGLPPDRQVVGCPWQWPQRHPFELLEWALPGRAVLAAASHVSAPGARRGVEFVDRGGLNTTKICWIGAERGGEEVSSQRWFVVHLQENTSGRTA